MKDKKYHHGDLKKALIEKGIEVINEEGISNLSLRKIANACGVSHGAPYSHFSNKENFVLEVQDYVANELFQALKRTVENYNISLELILELGISYVDFFMKNTKYFKFIYFQSTFELTLHIEDNNIFSNNFLPFDFFKEVSEKCMLNEDISNEKFMENILIMWSTVHGFCSIFIMKGTYYNGDWKQLLRRLLVEKVDLLN